MRFAVAITALITTGGCAHHQHVLPGVLDMRTDGREAPTTTARDPGGRVTRTGSEGYVQGTGVSVFGREVHVEDRHYFLLGIFPVYNDDPRPEMSAAIGLADGLVDVEIGEQMSVVDVLGGMVVRMVFAPAAWVTPSWTFTARGVLARDEMQRFEPAPPPTGDAPPILLAPGPP